MCVELCKKTVQDVIEVPVCADPFDRKFQRQSQFCYPFQDLSLLWCSLKAQNNSVSPKKKLYIAKSIVRHRYLPMGMVC